MCDGILYNVKICGMVTIITPLCSTGIALIEILLLANCERKCLQYFYNFELQLYPIRSEV